MRNQSTTPTGTQGEAPSSRSPLGHCRLVAFVATCDASRAKAFYRDTLGLRLVSEDGFALVFDVNGTMLRVQVVQHVTPAPYTVLGWEVADVAATAEALRTAGVVLERYPGMQQDDLGIWTPPGGGQVAWFKDPDGNTLSASQH
jgi:catechol 2,3-dioxygenase-like lactoylglutathione lyase family enzyme